MDALQTMQEVLLWCHKGLREKLMENQEVLQKATEKLTKAEKEIYEIDITIKTLERLGLTARTGGKGDT